MASSVDPLTVLHRRVPPQPPGSLNERGGGSQIAQEVIEVHIKRGFDGLCAHDDQRFTALRPRSHRLLNLASHFKAVGAGHPRVQYQDIRT
jgi:hypothetical protein